MEEKIEKNKKRKSIAKLIVAIAVFIIILVGITYAFFNTNILGGKISSITTEGIKFSYAEGTENISLSSNLQLTDAEGKSSASYFDFEVGLKTSVNTELWYIIYMEKDKTSTLPDSALKVYLTDQSNNQITNINKVSNLDLYFPVNNAYEIYATSISSNNDNKTTHKYRLRAWIDSKYKPESKIIENPDGSQTITTVEKTYKFKVHVTTIEARCDEFAANFGGIASDVFYEVATTNNDEYIAVGIAGQSDLSAYGIINKGDEDAIIVKYDGSGAISWAKNFGGTANDLFNSVVVATNDGSYVAVGNSSSDLSEYGLIGKGNQDAIIVKYNKDGVIAWTKNFGNAATDNFESVVADNDGGYIAVGYSNSDLSSYGITGKSGHDAIIIKYDSNGNIVWTKNFGGTGADAFYNITKTNDNGFIVVGASTSNLSAYGLTAQGNYDAIIVKYDGSGNIIWVKNFGGTNIDDYKSVTVTNDESYIAVGYSYSNLDAYGLTAQGNQDAIIVKYDRLGNIIWVKNFGGTNIDDYKSVTAINDDEYIVVGSSTSNLDAYGLTAQGNYDAIIVKYDGSGNIIMVKNFGGTGADTFNSIKQKSNDIEYVVVGASTSNLSAYGITTKGNYDGIIIKYCKGGEETSEGCFAYTQTSTAVTITDYKCFAGNSYGLPVVTDVVIPKRINGKPVVAIADTDFTAKAAFFEKGLTSIILPSTLKSIGQCAFNKNPGIKRLVIPNNVTSIGNWAFTESGITGKLIIPDNVILIGKGAFDRNNITNLVLGDNIKTIGDSAFYDNNISGTLIIPEGITSIGYQTFTTNNIANLILPNSLQSIGYHAFSSNKMTTLIIPDNVVTIDQNAFANINNLTSVTFGKNLQFIGSGAFSQCNLSVVTIPSNVETINSGAFRKGPPSSNVSLTKIINKTGRTFDWGQVINSVSGYNFITGTVIASSGNVEVSSN